MTTNKILVIGSSNTDMTVKTAKLPVPGETVLGGEFTMGAGGKGANQAVAAKRLGGDVSFICKVGKDVFGDNAIIQYESEGLDTSLIMRSEKPSGVALITVDENAENCIVVASGANNDVSVEDIKGLAQTIRKASILLLQLETPVSAVLEAARIAHNAGVTVILNPAPACILPDELYEYISILIPNRTEISTLSGIEVNDENSLHTAVLHLKSKGVRKVVVTLGAKGSVIYDSENITAVPAEKVDAVDTTAAGDTFCGGICVGLSEDKTLEESVRFATSAAARTVQKMGAQASIPYRNEL